LAGWETVLKAPRLRVASLPYRVFHICRHFLRRDVLVRFRGAARVYGVSVPVIAWRAFRWYAADRFLPDESLSRGLLHPSEPIRAAGDHISEERLHGLQHAVNSSGAAMCRDKLLFHVYCNRHGLPTPRLFAVLSRNGCRDASGQPLASETQWQSFIAEQVPDTFIAKPRHGRQGRDIRLLGVAQACGGGEPAEQLLRELRALVGHTDEQILEERLQVHERIAALTGSSALSTVRVFSWITSEGEPEILDAYFRGIVGDRLTDNISDCQTGLFTGNITARPELETGVLRRAWAYNANGIGYRWVDSHPVTGAGIKGFRLPCWPQVRALVCEAALRFLPVRTVGWDVALTPDGPVLIEANERFQHAGFGEGVRRIRSALQEEKQRLASSLSSEVVDGR